MTEFIDRIIEQQVIDSLSNNYVTALLVPRKCDKSTLAKQIVKTFPDTVFIDLGEVG